MRLQPVDEAWYLVCNIPGTSLGVYQGGFLSPPFFVGMPRTEITAKMLDICEPVVNDAGYELVDLECRREQLGWVVRVYIDSGEGISFADCERVSRELGPVLDVADPLPHAYRLEVSSPGVDRPLRTLGHFQQRIGAVAKVVLSRGIDGRRNFQGELVGVEGDAIVIEVGDRTFRLPVADISNAKIVPNWDDLLQQA